jgi:hypothetical protein
VFSSTGDAFALALVLGAPIRANHAAVETTESDKSVAEALAIIDNCSTALRPVRALQTVTNFCHAQQQHGSGSRS